jgi:hypothetical protein
MRPYLHSYVDNSSVGHGYPIGGSVIADQRVGRELLLVEVDVDEKGAEYTEAGEGGQAAPRCRARMAGWRSRPSSMARAIAAMIDSAAP